MIFLIWRLERSNSGNNRNFFLEGGISLVFLGLSWELRQVGVYCKTSKVKRWRHVGKLWRHCIYFDLWPKFTFSLKITFYLAKTENRTKKSLKQLSHYWFVYSKKFSQKMLFFLQKHVDISKMMKGLKLHMHVYLRTYQISSF